MAHVVVVGAGAIGSHLLPHLARSPRIARLTVIDRDCYEAANVRTQHIDTGHVGQPKATVQARRLRRINPRLEIAAVRAQVEDVPLGALRASAILACLDSRTARMAVNQAAWRLGVPWIDAGIDGSGLLARVRAFVPARDAACLECAWDQADYDAVEQAYPCAFVSSAAATAGPSMLGALAAAIQAIECDKLLAGDSVSALVGRDVLLDARHHKHYVTEYRRSGSCRMPDHDGWLITPLGGRCSETTLGDIVMLGSTLRGAGRGLWCGVAGQSLATELRCPSCVVSRATFQLERRVRASHPRCPQCGATLKRTGLGLGDMLSVDAVPDEARDCSLAELGLLPHDVLTLRTSELDAHFELE